VELLQLYIPTRDSGWDDVISNSTGSVAGFVLFQLCGGVILGQMSRFEDLFEAWLSPLRAALLLAAYFAVCLGISVDLQKDTRLSNWDPRSLLFVGNDASGRDPWRGQVYQLQIWGRALSDQLVRKMAGGESPDDVNSGLLASYDLTNSPPYLDGRKYLPPLDWTPEQPPSTGARPAEFAARTWLTSGVSVDNLTQEIMKSGQFTIHVVCRPSATERANGHIVSLSQSGDNVNFHLRQEGQYLVFWFRNPLSKKRSVLAWYVPGAFEAGKAIDIVASYDGSDAFIYLNGYRLPQIYHLSPGASLMRRFSFVHTSELNGDIIVYETLIFLPAGLLIGVAALRRFRKTNSGRIMLVLGSVLPAVLLELLLAGVSGRGIWPKNIVLSLVFGLAGVLLINADQRSKTFARTP
jgi:hypothetical protein